MRIRVPASIANLGPGFDVLALALDLWLEVEAEPADEPDWEFEGEGAELLNGADNPLSVLRFRGWVSSEIPVGVGLGSSAAARVAAAVLQGADDPIGAAGREEGHYDNVAAAVLGGLVAVIEDEVQSLPPPGLEIALFVAPNPVSTEAARAVLPAQVERADAVFNLGRMASLVHTLYTRDWERLGVALDDRLHQPQRLPLYPWAADVMQAAREAGAHGAAIAGAGPSVFALCERNSADAVMDAMADAGPETGYAMLTKISKAGYEVDD
ncbi:MAG: homoserine kinase [Candidatus Dormibacter sp.]|uniref:homoserine kinase n=1 Tax=Candidatus Dormibacter sp. TaxID=2973982 RepID=UPI000DB3F127|nr:MAG: homoserine kinase [Candidatus Dormibacteraeota bacterium]